MLVKLQCAVVGMARSVFEVEIDDGGTTAALKQKIKEKNGDIKVPAWNMQLFLAKKKDGDWLNGTGAAKVGHLRVFEVMDPLLCLKNRKYFGENFQPSEGQVHVLVVVPQQKDTRKRTRGDQWFVDDDFSVKKRKVDEDDNRDDRVLRYFTMSSFPPLAHTAKKYATIVERKSSIVIFTELLHKVKSCFDAKTDANMIVTGNPGTGKSRFYLYCIFKLLRRDQAEVQKLPSFELVLNFDDIYHKYCPKENVFTELNKAEVGELSDQPAVLRLIEDKSSQLTGWKGVSILFAHPGLDGLSNYAKAESYTYIVPAWSLDELQDYNSLLSDEWKLTNDVLISRYNKFGGIPRLIFTVTEPENAFALSQAICRFSALDIITYAKCNHAVRDVNIQRVLEMIPSREDFRANFHLDFLSKYIAEEIVFKVSEKSLQKVSKFVIAHADDDSVTVRGKIYEMLCHKWFSMRKKHKLQLRPLCSGQPLRIFDIPEELPTVRFSSLNDIEVVQSWTYYRPTSETFGALDAFIVTDKECLGLQMTLNQEHGIKAASLSRFLKWLEDAGIATNQLHLAFIVPSNLEGSFQKQTIQKKDGSKDMRPGAADSVNQFVAALDPFVGDN